MTQGRSMDAGPAQVGLTLQRGGEELLLEKARDRLTIRLSDASSLDVLQAQIQPQWVRPVAQGQLIECGIQAERLEHCLQRLRQQPDVQFASHVYYLARHPETWIYLTEQITLQFTPQLGPEQRSALIEPQGLAVLSPLAGLPNTFICVATPQAQENPIKIANRLMAREAVLTAEPNVVITTEPLYRPQDGLYTQQWHLNAGSGVDVRTDADISVEVAWEVTTGARSVVVAVSDDAFDLHHPDLQGLGKLVAPKDLKARDAVPLPTGSDESHGTACAGLAIGEENQSGIVGVAPGCGFMPIRTTGFLDDSSIETLFQWAVNQGAAVISCSWSAAAVYFPLSLRQRQALTQAATQGRDGKGCVIVFSAGNANRPVSGTIQEQGWPQNALSGSTTWLSGFAVHPDVIAVSACTSLNRKAAYSNWGDHIAVVAPSNNASPNMALPSVGTVSTGPQIKTRLTGRGMVTSDRVGGSGYSNSAYTQTFGGTSSACPVVAGVAGLVLSANPDLTAREVKQILQETADKIIDTTPDPQLGFSLGTYDNNGHSQWFGYGRVNAARAVQVARQRAEQGQQYSQTVTQSDNAAATIPDGDARGLTRSLRVSTQATVKDIQLQVTVSHEYLSDLTLSLFAPSGTSVLLQGRTLGNQSYLDQVYTLKTTPTLSRLLGENAAGVWRLQAIDHAPGHTGTLQQWQLTLALD
ncbi:MAG: S8 family serine peptidase [Leptolyngbyaceae cyanobacterium]